MQKILIFGNSGSGKSTLAREMSQTHGLAHLDLDIVAWEPTEPPTRRKLELSRSEIDKFTESNSGWIIEGCYSDLLEIAAENANEIIYLNLPVEACIQNAKNRPWEPHKYVSKQAQDANLEMLINWISDYDKRDLTFSAKEHLRLYEGFDGKKRMFESNENTIELLKI